MIDPEADEVRASATLSTAATARAGVEEELRSAHQSLEAERKELARAQALARIGSWRSDLQHKTLLWSAETYRIFGMRAEEEASYAAFFERVHPDDRALVAAAFDLSVARHEPFVYEHRIVLSDGTLKWVQERCEFFYDGDGRPLEAAGTIQDITERRTAEEVLKRSEQLLRIASRAGRMGGWDVDMITHAVSWSDEVCAIHGMPAGYHPQLQEAINFYAPEFRDAITKCVSACISEGTPFDVELQIIKRGGERIWVRAMGEARFDQAGVVIGMGGAFQDISERVAAAQALRESDERFRLVAQATTDVVWDWNLVDDTCWWSDGLASKFGHPAGESSTSTFWVGNIHPEDRARVMEAMYKAIASDSVWAAEYRFQKADGTYALVTDRAMLARDGSGSAHRMVGAMVDVSEQRTLESRLARAQRLAGLGQLAANMAHEFNNVLMGIQPFAEVIARAADDLPVARDAATRILQSVRRGKDVTTEILRFQEGSGPIDQPADVRDWLIDLAAESAGDAGGVSPGLTTGRPPSTSTVPNLPRSVLIVDDERPVAEGISLLLELEGVESVIVFEGLAAVPAIDRHDPDLVLLDIGLPDISGVEVFTQIHARWPTRRVVLMTGHYSALDIASILELPNVRFLQKPFSMDELLTALVAAS